MNQLSLLDLQPIDPAPAEAQPALPIINAELPPFCVGDRVEIVDVVMHPKELIGSSAVVYEVLTSIVRVRCEDDRKWTFPPRCLKLAPTSAVLWLECKLRYCQNLQARYSSLSFAELKIGEKTHLIEVRKLEISRLQAECDRLAAEIEDLRGGEA